MSEKEKTILENLANTIKDLPEDKKQYVAGLADGMALMAESRKEDKK